jgi:hypothetical protein
MHWYENNNITKPEDLPQSAFQYDRPFLTKNVELRAENDAWMLCT